MKVIRELVDDIQKRTLCARGYTLQAVLLHDTHNGAGQIGVMGERMIHGFTLEKERLLLHVREEGECVTTEPLLKELADVSEKMMRQKVEVLIETQHKHFEVIGFALSKELQRYLLFLTY